RSIRVEPLRQISRRLASDCERCPRADKLAGPTAKRGRSARPGTATSVWNRGSASWAPFRRDSGGLAKVIDSQLADQSPNTGAFGLRRAIPDLQRGLRPNPIALADRFQHYDILSDLGKLVAAG